MFADSRVPTFHDGGAMKIKRYQALTMHEALRSVKEDLGPDAVILSSQQIKNAGGVFGMFDRPMVEITAAIDPGPATDDSPEQAATFKKELHAASVFAPLQQDLALIREEIQSLRRATAGRLATARSHPEGEGGVPATPWKEIREEIYELRNMVRTLTNGSAQANAQDEPRTQEDMLPPLLAQEYQRLSLRGVDPQVVKKVMTFMTEKLSSEQLAQPTLVQSYLDDLLACTVQVAGPLLDRPGLQKVVLFVGATGVGKTTTLAKLAAHYREKTDCHIAVATLDTHRVAAMEQLKMYTRVLGIPVDVAISPQELTKIVQRHKQKDLVLVDTAGRSPSDLAGMGELKELGDAGLPLEIHLVLSASTKQTDLDETVKQFSVLPIHRLLFTKLDETGSCATVFNTLNRTGKPISYFTAGQRVPDDIEVATPKRVLDLVMNLPSPEMAFA